MKSPQSSFRFLTRHSELDRFAHINNANYLRYIEHARWLFYKSCGIDEKTFRETGTKFVVHKLDASFRIPMGAEKELEARIEKRQVGKIRGDYHQKIIDVESGHPAFEAEIEWALVGRNTKRPLGDFAEKFLGFINALPEATSRKPKPLAWPTAVVQERKSNQIEFQAQPYELDSFDHVNNANYFQYLERGRWAFFDEVGIMGADVDHQQGLILARQRIHFHSEVGLLENLRLNTYVLDISKIRLQLFQVITNRDTGKLICESRAELCGIETNTGRPQKLSYEFLEHFKGYY